MPSRILAIVVGLWLAQAPFARADEEPDTPETTIAQLHDLTDADTPRYTFLNPQRLDGFTRFTAAGTAVGGTLQLERFWFGGRAGRAYFFPDLQLSVLAATSGPGGVSTILGGTFLRVDDQYVCRELSDGIVHFLRPIADDLSWSRDPSHQGCRSHETIAYFGDLLTVDWRPTLAHVAVRLVDAGLSYNLLATGRTREAFSDLLEVRQGFSLDWVTPGATSTLNRALALRLDEGLRCALASPGGAWRANLEGHYRPRIVDPNDTLWEATAGLSRLLVLSRKAILVLTAKAGVSYANRPWMTVSSWADPTQPWSALVAIEISLDRRMRSPQFALVE